MRIACFVDYSNLVGSLRKMNMQIKDYQCFFKHIIEESYKKLTVVFVKEPRQSETMLTRIYWYAVGSVDNYDFSDSQVKKLLEKLFNEAVNIKHMLMSEIGKQYSGISSSDTYSKAFDEFYRDRKAWYEERLSTVEKYRGFYDSIRRTCDFIDINDTGHWKLDFISKSVNEKGIDTALSVDSATMINSYDVALIVSGDADMIPSVKYIKGQGKYVGSVSFIKGHPPERKGRQQSSRLSKITDFDVPIYETDLQRLGCAEKTTNK